MRFPKLWFHGVLKCLVLGSIVAAPFFAQDLLAQVNVTPATVPQATKGAFYSQSFTATGGVPPYTWNISGLPAGLSASGSNTITISGIPTATGSFNLTVRATDSTTPGPKLSGTVNPTLVVVAPPPLGISPATAPAGTVFVPYSTTTFSGSGGIPPYSVSITGSVPGLTATAGTISGTPTTAGTYSISVHVTDSATPTQTLNQPLSIVISPAPPPPLSLSPSSPPPATVQASYNVMFTASGGTAPYTVTVSGTLPQGLTATGGTISGTPGAAGTYPITVKATDSTTPTPMTVTINPSLIVNPAPLSVSTTSAPAGTVGTSYTLPLVAVGGTGSYNWSVSGSLPDGLTRTGATISGTPTREGTFSFTVQVTDSGTPTPQTASGSLSIVINPAPLSVSTTSAPAGTVGTTYTLPLVAVGGTGSYNWSVSGSLPDGLTRTGATISGTPTRQGTFSFTVQVTDSGTPAPQTASSSLSIVINPAPLSISTTSAPAGTVGTSYTLPLVAVGGTGSYNWSVSGSLPDGLTRTGATIGGTPSRQGTFSFTVQVTDSGTPTPQTASGSLSIVINPASLVITTTSPPAATVGVPYTLSLGAGGGTSPYSWTISGSLPDGLTRTDATISGTPTRQGTFGFTVQVTDSGTPTPQTASGPLSIVVNPPPLIVSTTTLPSGTLGVPYLQTLSATGGTGAYSWSVTGNLPLGLSLSGATISGTPVLAGTSSFVVHVIDGGSPAQNAQQSLIITIVTAPLLITTSSLPPATAAIPYSQTLTATGGTPPFTWSLVPGNQLPAGLSLSTGGTISGTPTAPGNVTFTVQVRDSSSPATLSTTRAFSILVSPPSLQITTSSLAAATVGVAYSQPLVATGGSGPYTWSIAAGSLPVGLSLNGATIVGVPTAPATANFTVRVSDSSLPSQITEKPFTLLVIAQLTIITSSPLPAGTVGSTYSQNLVAAGGTPAYSWSISSGSLPPGLNLSAAGTLSGQPLSPGTSSFTLLVTDASSPRQSAEQAFDLIVGASISITTASLPPGVAGTPYSQTLIATGGGSPYHWSLADGQLPSGITVSDAGLISGTPVNVGLFDLTIRVTDSALPQRSVTKAFQLRIDPPAGQPLQITTQSVPSGILNFPYSQQIDATGGAVPYTWSVTGGNVPSGLILTPSGVLQGTPSSTSSATVTIRVTDPTGGSDTRAFPIAVGPAIGLLSSNGLASAVNPAQQVPFTLSLSAAYPVAISGSLTVSFTSDAVAPSDDPAMQFATGGRTVSFSFPANSTTAALPSQLILMSGTVAGTITLTGRIQNGPSGIALGSIAVRSLAPQISNVVASRIGGGLRVQITGYSPERRLTEVDFGFDVRLPSGVQTVTVTKPAESEFRDWYQGPASSQFGSTFLFEQNFGVNGDVSAIEAVTVTMKNGQGSTTSSRALFQ